MKNARIIIGANYGDEGKGTVTAFYSKGKNTLNVLTNGGAQRGHTVITSNGPICYQHFGSGTHYGAASYYSCFYILNPIQFASEYKKLIIKPINIYRDANCLWSTPYDAMANMIESSLKGSHNTCGMGIWNTLKRTKCMGFVPFDNFINCENKELFLTNIKKYYEKYLTIPTEWEKIWENPNIFVNFIEDCQFLFNYTKVASLKDLDYNNLIFENGQGLLLNDNGKDTSDTTPSKTGIDDALLLLKDIPDIEITAHYVTRPYLTRHGDGPIIDGETTKEMQSSNIAEDINNHFNSNQGSFRYGNLNITKLYERIQEDSKGVSFELEVTHCDEMDRIKEFKKCFPKLNTFSL